MKIYHNPRCSKSRQGLAIVEKSGISFEVVKYLDTNISLKELQKIVDLLKIEPVQLVRKNEIIWKENYKNKELTDSEILNAMVEHPKLIERPIVINNGKAVIGRPPEIIKSIL